MKLILLLLPLQICLLSCGTEPAQSPLAATRAKLGEAASVSFKMQSVWNNTFVGDTAVNAPHTGTYLRTDRETFPYDFVYEAESTTFTYVNGKLEDIQREKGRIVTYTDEEATVDLAREGNYSTTMTPMAIVQDTAWVRAGRVADTVYYAKVVYDKEDEYGHAYTIERLGIDSLTSDIVTQERIYTLDGKPMQHIRREFFDYAYNDTDNLAYERPEGFQVVASSELEQLEERALIKAGDRLPEFKLANVDGNGYTTQLLRGKKVVFVFSFIGCGGCELARKHLARVGFRFNDDYVALYINPTNTAEQIVRYHEDKPWPFRLAAADYDFSAAFGVSSYPTFIAVDERGKVEEVVEGYEEMEFTAFLKDKGTVR